MLAVASTIALAAPPAHAVDGCLVLLCLAAPSWRAIPQCVPPIRQLFSDLRRGRPFPTCSMAGPGNNSRHQWAMAPSFCPPQYTREVWAANGPRYVCDYRGAISVSVDGQFWSRTWWTSGDSVTEFSDAAKASLIDGWDTRFDDEYARWEAGQRPAGS
ncbi:hypothetical protein CKO44_06055 [Rubrivivax gelatinosus]|nr:hypothetical protein [Rubrivivax gelatinosus]MBZ8142826.1 hypothetical protein [Rubrivivax gelatinosus]